jgi:hypothetical protein
MEGDMERDNWEERHRERKNGCKAENDQRKG